MKKLFLLLFFVVLFISQNLQAAFFDPKLNWKTIETTHFRIHYHDGIEEVAKEMSEVSEEIYDELTPRYEWKPKAKTEVVLTDHQDLTNAFAITLPYNYILIFLNSPEAESSLNYYDDWMSDLFRHEFTHILHIDKHGGITKAFRWVLGKIVTPNGLTPAWVREGIAVYEESRHGKGRNNSSFSDMIIRMDSLDGKFLSIDKANGEAGVFPGRNTAYFYGGAFWEYLAKTYGEEKITEYIRRQGNSIWFASLNNKAKKTFQNKSFVKLWKEWELSLKAKYLAQKEKIESLGLSTLKTLQKNEGLISAYALSPNSEKMVYVKSGPSQLPQIVLFDFKTRKEEVLLKNQSAKHLAFSPDGKKILYHQIANQKFFYLYNELYEFDLEKKKSKKLTQGARAFDGSYSASGDKIIYVSNKAGSSELYEWQRESQKSTKLTHSPKYTQYSRPIYSPDGKQIAVSAWMKGQRDLYLLNTQDGKILKNLTQDPSIENDPIFDQSGQTLYYSSDKTGVSNIYKLSLSAKDDSSIQITNVMSGLFRPSLTKEGKLITQHYYPNGFEIVEVEEKEFAKLENKSPPKLKEPAPLEESKTENSNHPSLTSKKYSAFPQALIPRFVLPGFYYSDGLALASLATFNADPLAYHLWSAQFTYRFDGNYPGGSFYYKYNRPLIPFYLQFNRYLVNYGDLFRINQDYYEGRNRVSAGIDSQIHFHHFDLSYNFEHRSNESNFSLSNSSRLNLGNYSGFAFSYNFDSREKSTAGISAEQGLKLRLSTEINSRIFGSSSNNETKIVEGDLRYYLKMPWANHHVLALRTAGGANFGDKLFQGVFRLGTALGEGSFSKGAAKLYPLRGLPQITFAGDRALLFSGEYRFPVYEVERGVGTLPFYFKSLHLGIFSDAGSVFNDSPKWNDFLLSVGAELRADFELFYGLPLTTRLGYAKIVKGTERLEGLLDPILGTSIKNGTLIFELGTSF